MIICTPRHASYTTYMWDVNLEFVIVLTISKCSVHLKTAVATLTPEGIWLSQQEKVRRKKSWSVFEMMSKFGQKAAKEKPKKWTDSPKTTFGGKSELTTTAWQTEQKKIRVTAAFNLEEQQGKREPAPPWERQSGAEHWVDTQDGPSCCLGTLQTAALRRCASGEQEFKCKVHLSDEWDARERRDLVAESRRTAVWAQGQMMKTDRARSTITA